MASEAALMQRYKRAINCLRVLRLLLALTMPSYLHPDEHFQSTEIAYSLFFNSHSASPVGRTWEWQPLRPCRSIVPVWLMTGWALWLLSLFTDQPSASLNHILALSSMLTGARTLLLVERAAMFVVSLVSELAAEGISRKATIEDAAAVMLYNSSAVAMVWLSRPFSNSLSALLLLPLHAIARRAHARTLTPRLLDLAWVLCAVGLWARIDFLAFVAPIAAYLLFVASSHTGRSWSLSSALTHLPALRLQAGLIAVAILIGCDTRFFATTERARWQPVVTPLNSLLYNVQSSNLVEHGTHPYWLHAVVHLPLLFGIGVPCAVYAIWHVREDTMARLCATILASGVGALSLVPHQEPRFMLPCVWPMCVLVAKGSVEKYSKRGTLWRWHHTWLLHTLLCVVFFGFLHHGGTLPALMQIQRRLAPQLEPRQIVVWKTLMPPLHLTLPSRGSKEHVVQHKLVDLAGSDADKLATTLMASERSFLVAPHYQVVKMSFALCLERLSMHGWHVDPDHFDTLFANGVNSASVGIYEVTEGCRDIADKH